MGKKSTWNDRVELNQLRKLTRDPLHQFPREIFYSQGITNGNMAYIESQPIKTDRYGILHGVML